MRIECNDFSNEIYLLFSPAVRDGGECEAPWALLCTNLYITMPK